MRNALRADSCYDANDAFSSKYSFLNTAQNPLSHKSWYVWYYQVVADASFSNVDKFSNVFKSSNGAYLNLATLLSPQNTVFKSSYSSLKPLYGIPYHLETRQRGLNNVYQPYMTS